MAAVCRMNRAKQGSVSLQTFDSHSINLDQARRSIHSAVFVAHHPQDLVHGLRMQVSHIHAWLAIFDI